jgi:hypothetical protein
MSLRAPHNVFVILLVLWMGGCANATVADRPMRLANQPDHPARTTLKSYSEQISGFDQSLTKAEKKAFIGELQNARERAQHAGRVRRVGSILKAIPAVAKISNAPSHAGCRLAHVYSLGFTTWC